MKIRTPGTLSKEHEQLGIPPAEASASGQVAHPVLNLAAWFTLAVVAACSVYLASRVNLHMFVEGPFWAAVAVGFFAQAVDGALGMAYGVTATTFLLSTGASPAAASASVVIGRRSISCQIFLMMSVLASVASLASLSVAASAV
ncbi:MAG: hypothetical protein ACREVB_14085, partial [Burkholderiales bacterium]